MFKEHELNDYKAELQKIGITENDMMNDVLNELYTLATVVYEIINCKN